MLETPQPRVLLISDRKNEMESISAALEKSGLDCYGAADGVEGIRMVYQAHPEIVVSPISIPELDGFQICRLLKNDIGTRHIVIVLLTEQGAAGGQPWKSEVGADRYIERSASPEDIAAACQDIIAQRDGSPRPIQRVGPEVLERRHQWQRRVSHILEEKLFRLTAINRVNPGLCRHEDPVANRRAIFGQLHQVIEFEVSILFADRDPDCVATLCSPLSRDSFKPLQKIMRGRLAADGFSGSAFSDKVNIILGSEYLRDSSGTLASTAAVSLQSSERVIGCLGIGSSRPNAFTPDDLALLDMFALQTAVVLENTLLHEHNAVLAAAIEHLSDAVLVTDLNELVIHANPAANALFSMPLEEIRGHRARRIFSPRFPPEQIEQIFEATRAGGWDGETLALRAKNDFPMDLRTAIVRARKGTPIALVFLCKDLTQHKQLEKERLQAAELATLLETAIALNHEINNPLQVILTCAQLLQFQLKEQGQEIHEKLTMIVDQSQRIAEVTHKLEQAKSPVRRNYVLGQAMIDIEESARRQ